jgi:hypothetical protein
VLSKPAHVVDGRSIRVESKSARSQKKPKELWTQELAPSSKESQGFFGSGSGLPTDPDLRSSTVDGGRTQTIFESHSPREMIRSPRSRDRHRDSFSLRQPPQIQSCKIIDTHPTPDAGLQAAPSPPFFRIGHPTRVHSTEQLYEPRPEECLFQQKHHFEMKRKPHPTSVRVDLDTSFNLQQSPVQHRDRHFFRQKAADSPEPPKIGMDGSQSSSDSHGPRSTGTRYKVFYRHLKRLSTNRQSRCKRMTAAVHYQHVVECTIDAAANREKRVDYFLDKLARVLGSPLSGG